MRLLHCILRWGLAAILILARLTTAGRDAFHRVPFFALFSNWNAVERVPTGLKMGIARYLATGLAVVLLGFAHESQASTNRLKVILVVGAAGESEFGTNFVRQAKLWEDACVAAGCPSLTIGLDPMEQTNDWDRLKLTFEQEPKQGTEQLWLVLMGHGTFDGKEAKFNLRGPDVSASEMADWLKPFERPLAIIDTTSASAPFLNKLSGTNRIVITATRSGYEENYTRFGANMAESITNLQADLDKDGQVSLLEAFLIASRQTTEFYKLNGRLATEHALLDDNGDGMGTPADWFRGIRAIKKPKENVVVDGLLAQQFQLIESETERKLSPEDRARRDALERSIFTLRETKSKLPEEQYYQELEKLLVELARVYGFAETNKAL